eukprot:TRINITY_DN882_c0_g1_i1.p1 TRINITY_DN882_c0_g1~~TRINITY_DN882_c0_g1_i1.p1  ORF type:complete len:260 (-),score=50.81 TRINITY_DN882_c0_g1_i1:431-1210(-)
MCITQPTRVTEAPAALPLQEWFANAADSCEATGLTCELPAVSLYSPCWVPLACELQLRKQVSAVSACGSTQSPSSAVPSCSSSNPDDLHCDQGDEFDFAVSDDEDCYRGPGCPGGEGLTTVMIKGIPARCNQKQLLQAVEERGFQGQHTFFYMPTRRNACQNRGYAFMTMKDSETAYRFCQLMDGYTFSDRVSNKALTVTLAEHHSKAVGGARRQEKQKASEATSKSVQEPLCFSAPPGLEHMLRSPPRTAVPMPTGLM